MCKYLGKERYDGEYSICKSPEVRACLVCDQGIAQKPLWLDRSERENGVDQVRQAERWVMHMDPTVCL